MQIRSINRPIFDLPESHPARMFLEEFIECRQECLGREIGSPQREPVDQDWMSQRDGRPWSFSEFAYRNLAYDIELDGWLTSAPQLTDSERADLESLSNARPLLAECLSAATRDGNAAVSALVEKVLHLFDLWENCIRYRMANVRNDG
jgi:hypothetical protein